MKPSPRAVALVVSDLLTAEWPCSEQERKAWFDRFGLTPTVPLEGFRRWGTGIKDWGDTTTCWGMSKDGFTGVSWFLWEGASFEERAVSRDALEAQLRETLGEPHLRSVPGHSGWLEWERNGITIELCSGDPLARRVQLHVVHEERADDAEERTCTDEPPSAAADDSTVLGGKVTARVPA